MNERYQERIYKPEIVKLYGDTLFKITGIIKNLELESDYKLKIKCDLVSMLYVVADYAALSTNNRNIITTDLHEHLPTLIPYSLQKDSHFTENSTFILRTEFYGKIIRKEIKVRGEVLLSDIPKNAENIPVIRCAVAFCDILKNPLLFSNYSKAPVMIFGFDKDLDFVNSVALPIIDIVLKFVGDVIGIGKEEQEQEKETPNEKLRLPDGCHSIEENSKEECSEGQEADIPSSNESSSNSNYKEARKAAREKYKEKKKELKTTYPKQNGNKYKIATIVLSILFLGATIANIGQFIYYEECIADLISEIESLKNIIIDKHFSDVYGWQ